MRVVQLGLAFVVVAVPFFGCANLLSIEDISLADGGVVLSEDGGAVPDGVAECVRDADCEAKLPETVSGVRCAEAKCKSNRCVFVARDRDGDGVTVACVSKDPQRPIAQSQTLDCDDDAPGVVANSELDCTDGSFALPGLGECRPGKKRCNADGTFGACSGVVGKKVESCSNNLDDDCDGTVNNGCTCSPGDTQPCGTSTVGICRKGTQTCVGGLWAASCTGAVFPQARACSSANDNDCNGTPDNQDASCKCDGTVAGGVTRACTTGLAGICSAGMQTCVVGASAASWSPCAGNNSPQARSCESADDNDCNGSVDRTETPCKCGGTYFVGNSINCPKNLGAKTCESLGSTAQWGACDFL
jgi:hypothetical protein